MPTIGGASFALVHANDALRTSAHPMWHTLSRYVAHLIVLLASDLLCV
jgi:hypothetical protein